ncbi:hypothetical protein AB1L30_13135 [Bremerella sp. JC817]|uniref:hypothetical protein n=1 Tax=Bremerella sp. JC817 TaxID=3231756 RepID=UPI00345B09C4
MQRIHSLTIRSIIGLTAACSLAFAGCGGDSQASDDSQLVQGVIYCGKTPLKEGTVRFEPDPSNPSHPSATGQIQTDGTFHLATESGEALPPGRYRVIVADSSGGVDGNVRSRSGEICIYGDTGQIAQITAGGSHQFHFRMPGPDGPRDMPEGE